MNNSTEPDEVNKDIEERINEAVNESFNDDNSIDDDIWEPCDDCDLPDACADFGCAIKKGLRKPKDW